MTIVTRTEDIWAEADRTGRIEARVHCHCSKRPGDKPLCVNTQKRTGVCHRCGLKVTGKDSGHFSRKYIADLDNVVKLPDHGATEARAQCAVRLATPAPSNHPYLIRKGVQAHGIGVLGELYKDLPGIVRGKGNVLVVMMQDTRGRILSCQFIAEDGSKAYLSGPKRRGGFYLIPGKSRLWIVEGFATGASLHEDTGDTVAVAFDSNGLHPVADALTLLYGTRREILIMADDDWQTPGNPGLTKAQEAAAATGIKALKPDFTGLKRGPTESDYNDLARLRP